MAPRLTGTCARFLKMANNARANLDSAFLALCSTFTEDNFQAQGSSSSVSVGEDGLSNGNA